MGSFVFGEAVCADLLPDDLDTGHTRRSTKVSIIGLVVDDTLLYEKKCESSPGGLETAKEVERDVMLQSWTNGWRRCGHGLLGTGCASPGGWTRPLAASQGGLLDVRAPLRVNKRHDYVRYIAAHVEPRLSQLAKKDSRGINKHQRAPGGDRAPRRTRHPRRWANQPQRG